MTSVPSRLKFIYLPFAIVFFVVLIVDAFLYSWALADHFGDNDISDSQVKPLVLIVILLLICFRPRMMLFTEAIQKKALFVVAVVCIFIPVMFMQGYMITACGKLTTLQNIEDIRSTKVATMYYAVHDFYVARSYASKYETITYVGKNKEETDYDEYYAVPVFARASDTLHSMPVVWLGFDFHEKVKTREEEAYKNAVLKNFQITTSRKIDSLPVRSIKCMVRFFGRDFLSQYNNAIDSNPKIHGVSSRLILAASAATYKERNGHRLLYFILASLFCLWLTAAYVGSGSYDKEALHDYLEKHHIPKEFRT